MFFIMWCYNLCFGCKVWDDVFDVKEIDICLVIGSCIIECDLIVIVKVFIVIRVLN